MPTLVPPMNSVNKPHVFVGFRISIFKGFFWVHTIYETCCFANMLMQWKRNAYACLHAVLDEAGQAREILNVT